MKIHTPIYQRLFTLQQRLFAFGLESHSIVNWRFGCWLWLLSRVRRRTFSESHRTRLIILRFDIIVVSKECVWLFVCDGALWIVFIWDNSDCAHEEKPYRGHSVWNRCEVNSLCDSVPISKIHSMQLYEFELHFMSVKCRLSPPRLVFMLKSVLLLWLVLENPILKHVHLGQFTNSINTNFAFQI